MWKKQDKLASKYTNNSKPTKPKSYIQVLAPSINNIIKIKENFSNLLSRKIEEIYKVINEQKKTKPKINMTKDLLHKQVIVLMDSKNSTKILAKSLDYIANINWILKNIKSNTITNLIHNDYRELIITTNSIASPLDLRIIENYIKDINVIQSENIFLPCLPQSKSYLKIIDIPYFNCNTNTPINSKLVKQFI